MRSTLLGLLTLAALNAPASAQFRSSWDPASWIPDPTGLITFDGHADGELLTDQYLVSHGVSFENLEFNNPSAIFPDAPYAWNTIGGQPWSSIIIRFTTPVTALAFQAVANGGAGVFEAFLGNAMLFSVNTLTHQEPGWKGFENVTADWIRFTAPEDTNGLIGIDNVQWFRESGGDDLAPLDPTVVPEPATLVLVATGLAAVAAFRRRRRG
ncbi:MAG: PEP-CTERM sorting domain-containing protein [Gemmatimonadales bacterium]